MVVHEHHKSDLSEGSDEFAHFARIQKVLPEGSDFDNIAPDKDLRQLGFTHLFLA